MKFQIFIISSLLFYASADLTVDDLDLFDVVEDVKQNFYEFLEVPSNSTTADIRKAYRRLSLRYHPDKNPEPDAPEKFRKIAAVVEVLKDEKKRAKYHEVLEYGIPDWARSMYYRYYRKARKMGTMEMSIMMSIIATVAHALWMYASYWEQKFTLKSNIDEMIRRKKLRSSNTKKNKIAVEEVNERRDELMKLIKAPKVTDIWFICLPIGLFRFVVGLPGAIKEIIKNREQTVEDESDEEEVVVRPKRTPKQRDVKGAQVVSSIAPVTTTMEEKTKNQEKKLKTGPWSDNDVAALIRLLKKHPAGSQDRWDKIAETMQRSVADVTKKILSIRNNTSTNVIPDAMNSTKALWVESEITKKDEEDADNNENADSSDDEEEEGEDAANPANWTQAQQKQLEVAMVAFPKFTDGRWDHIAGRVSGKSKRQCIDRVKWLIENVKNKDQGA